MSRAPSAGDTRVALPPPATQPDISVCDEVAWASPAGEYYSMRRGLRVAGPYLKRLKAYVIEPQPLKMELERLGGPTRWG